MESSTRKDGGDVTWFESLPQKLNLKFKIEHWGHKNLLSLFLETPSLCLYYYPELVPDGSIHKKTIQDTRKRYNDNLNTLYHKIEFVGMSVYKEEATRGVLMEDIYIPLTVIPEKADEQTTSSRTNPLSFLEPGTHTAVLGDPGSGKSTLLKFLALVGLSPSLQERYNAIPESRLPIFITLRRYADELKARRNLSLIDYIQEVIQGDFNLKSADLAFFEYYLETGQAIFLFDGLDELPNPQFKKVVRDRIRTLLTSYPGNTTVVTSRIIGYGSPFRFDEKEFSHYKLARLGLPEIEQFVEDWYQIRTDNENVRETYIEDLIGILQNDDYGAIRELAENPLLLTIIVLVHRIDAVLPDERVILYQKCTETLLITWYNWKYHTEETRKSGKEERHNRNRIEEIAYWMHCRSVSTGTNERAVVDYSDLKKYLTIYIAEVERVSDPNSDPEDLAEEFLDFVRKHAGLLMEVGDNRYSFVHLTFQEYLASSCINRRGETGGVAKIWKTIEGNCGNARWHEVIRLLIAGLRADESREILVKKIVEETSNSQEVTHSLLLGGLLLDGIEAAEYRQGKILYYLFDSAIRAQESEELRLILDRLRIWNVKKKENEKAAIAAFKLVWENLENDDEKTALVLSGFALYWSEDEISQVVGKFLYEEDENAELLRLFLCEMSDLIPSPSLERRLELFWALKGFFSLRSPSMNIVSATLQAVITPLEASITAERGFVEQLSLLCSNPSKGPFPDYIRNSLELFAAEFSEVRKRGLDRGVVRDRALARALALALARALDRELDLEWDRGVVRELARELDRALDRELDRGLDRELDRARALALVLAREPDRGLELALARALDRARALALALARALDRELDLEWDRELDQELNRLQTQFSRAKFWENLLINNRFCTLILDSLCLVFGLEPRPQWREALHAQFFPKIQDRVTFYQETTWKEIRDSFDKGIVGRAEEYLAASLLILDSYFFIHGYHRSRDESIFRILADLTRKIDAPPLCIAHCIRDLAYGDESRTEDLVSMAKSDNPEYRKIFETALWRPGPK